MREIKFRAFEPNHKKWIYFTLNDLVAHTYVTTIWTTLQHLTQYTGLKDKNGLHEIYEGDIIDIEGHLIGNIHEHSNIYQEKTNLIIQGFGTKDWCSTHKKALERGCKDSE